MLSLAFLAGFSAWSIELARPGNSRSINRRLHPTKADFAELFGAGNAARGDLMQLNAGFGRLASSADDFRERTAVIITICRGEKGIDLAANAAWSGESP